MKTQYNVKNIGKYAGILLTGLLLGWLLFGGASSDQTTNMDQHVQEAHTDEQGEMVYTCSMHPSVRQNEPGNCPICGMELIPVSDSDAGEEANPQALTMTNAAMKLAEVQTTQVSREPAVKQIRMPGRVAVDEREISAIPAHFPGRVEELYLNFTGAYVEKGDRLASVYSPELVTAQKELLEAYQTRDRNPALYRSAREKLKNWEISDQQIDQILKTGEAQTDFDIYARQNGYVLERHISVGDHIELGKSMFKIASLSSVWVLFEAYESDLLGLEAGSQVSFTVESFPGRTFEADVTYIDPLINENQRTVSVRTEVDNEDGLLKPNMLAEGIISATLQDGQPVLQIPKESVMWTGERSIVYVQNKNAGQAQFAAREVVLGPRVGENYIVEEGLEEGEAVVIKGNFMIDSAAQLADKLSMMNREPRSGSGAPGMPGMDMGGETEANTEIKTQQSSAFAQDSDINKEQVPDAFKQQLGELAVAYLEIKIALTNDNMEKASSQVTNLPESLSNIDVNLIKNKKQSEVWTTHLNALEKHVGAVDQAEDLDGFRDQFALLSGALGETFSTFGVNRKLFVQFCPMEDAYWLSEEEEIINPYMKEEMRGCGETKGTLR